jgi:predicted PurR-regulated permease PerM
MVEALHIKPVAGRERVPPRPQGPGGAPRRLIVIGLLLALAALVVALIDVLLLAFGAVLVALLLNALSAPLTGRLGMPRPIALSVVTAAIVFAGAAGAWTFGREALDQLRTLAELLPTAWARAQAALAADPLGRLALGQLNAVKAPDELLLRLAPQITANLAAGVAAALIVGFAGLYLAYHPQTYLRGALSLVPPVARPRAEALATATDHALRRWLLGQLVSMALVGGTTTLGLWLAGVPTPLGLGLLAGAGQFVPVVGPMAAAVPGLTIALTEGPQTLAWAGLVYLGAAQLEANLITPLILRHMAQLPMALTLFAVLAMGLLLGPLGVLFATPLAIVAYLAVKMLYVEGFLGEGSALPADAAQEAGSA